MRMRQGFTLIECMIVVAIIGITSTAAWSIGHVLTASGTVGHQTAKMSEAQELLVEHFERLRSTPFDQLQTTVGESEQTLQSRIPGVRLWLAVNDVGPGLLRLDLTAQWRSRDAQRQLVLVGLRGDFAW